MKEQKQIFQASRTAANYFPLNIEKEAVGERRGVDIEDFMIKVNVICADLAIT